MATHALRILLTADHRAFDQALGKAGSGVKKFGAVAGAAGAAAGLGLAVGLKKSVDAAKEAEKSQAKLSAQLKASGSSYKAHGKQIDAVIQKHSKLAGVDDEDLQDAFSGIVRATGSVNTAMKDMGLVTDLARGKNMDLSKAGDLLSKVHNGNVGALKRLGIAFDPVTKAQDKLKESGVKATAEQVAAAKAADKTATGQAGIAELQKRFAGQAEAYGKTAAGAQDRFAVALENVQEKLGAKLLPLFGDAFNVASKFLDEIDSGTGIGGKFADVVGDIGGALSDAAGAIGDFWGKLKDSSKGGGAGIGKAIVEGLSGIDWRGLGETVSKGFNSALKLGGKIGASIIDAFKAVPWSQVGDLIGQGVEGSLDFADKLPAKISQGISAAAGAVNGRMILGKLVDVIGEAIDALFSPSFWMEHWKGIFATVTLAIPFAKILKIPGAATLFKFISKPVFEAIGFLGRGMGSLLSKAAAEGGVSFLAALSHLAPRTANLLLELVTRSPRALVSFPGKVAGFAVKAAVDFAKALGSATGTIAGKMAGWLIKGIAELGRAYARLLTQFGAIGKGIALGIIGGLGSLGHLLVDKIKQAVGYAKDKVKGIAKGIGGALNPFGDGVGHPSTASIPGLGGGGLLMGADADLAPFANLGASMGLRTTSGTNHSRLTSSNNVSYHTTGDAIDMAGPPSGMRRFAVALKRRFGSSLRELISPWGELGIKDGKPFRYSGAIQAQHSGSNAHVHVAYTGPFGDGPGRGGGRGGAFTGDGEGVVPAFRRAISSARATPIEQLALFEAGIVESGLRNLPYGDRDSVGALQQRPSQGWHGLMDPYKAALEFLSHAKGKRVWKGTAGQLAQAIQSSAFPARYDAVAGQARGYIGDSAETPSGGAGGTSGGASSGAASKPKAAPKFGPGAAAGTFAGAVESIGLRRAALDFKQAGPAKGQDNEMIKLVWEEMVLKNQRLAKIKKALKKKLTNATRTRLIDEATILMSDLTALSELMYELTGGKGGKLPEGGAGDAADTSGGGADGGSGGSGGSGGTGDTPDGPTEFDFLDANLAEAERTETKDDDRTALKGIADYRFREYQAALASGDPRRIAQTRRDLTSAEDAMKSLEDALVANTDALNSVRADLEKQRADSLQRDLNVSQSQYGVLAQAVTEVVSGTLGGTLGLGLSGLRAPAGAVSRT